MMRNRLPLFLLVVAVTGCSGQTDSDGNGGVGPATRAFTVIEGTVTAIDGDVLVVSDVDALGDLRRQGFAADSRVVADSDTLRLRFSEGDFAVGERYALFVGTWSGGEYSALYAHDLEADLPIAPWVERRSGNGSETAEVLECLRTAYGAAGERPGLEALITAITDANVRGGGDDTALRICTVG